MLLFLKLRSEDSRFCLYCLSFACALAFGKGYNLNTVNQKIFKDPNIGSTRASYFGFSTALYVKTDNKGRREAVVLVGAPRGNASTTPSVLEPGTVFYCDINDEDDNNRCIEWNLDSTINKKILVGKYLLLQRKNNAWTGGSIGVDYSTIEYPKVVVCAPNWKLDEAMVGLCYWSIGRDKKIFKNKADGKVAPMTTKGLCPNVSISVSQAGFSMHLYSEEKRSSLLLGSPGLAEARGSAILIEDSNYTYPIIPTCTANSTLVIEFEYLGYSVTSGDYHNNGLRWYAAGAPRYYHLLGQVMIFQFEKVNDTLDVPKNYKLVGTQWGEYFGASLASCDVNNDGKDEILVGAPFWSNDMDEGRIYVFSENHGKFKTLRPIDGTKIGARFGSVVTCLGDLDHDGYKDIAVGAPYEGNHGAVYIYNGGKEGLNKDFSQRIYGEDLFKGIRGFGAAISEPRDVDGNNYVDIAVGAYSSGHVVLLHSRPVVTIKVNFSNDTAKNLPTTTTLLTIIVCLTCDGFHIPEKLDVETTLQVDPLRAFYGSKPNNDGVYNLTAVVTTSKTECIPYNMTISKFNRKDPINIDASLALVPKFCDACPVVNKQKSKLNDSLQLNFVSLCNRGKKCLSNMNVEMWAAPGDLENGARYTLGSKSRVRVNVLVNNTGEAAYNAELHFFIPSPIFPGSTHSMCRNSNEDNTWEIICPLGNPLEKDTMNITFELDMNYVHSDTEHIELLANVLTQSDIHEEAKHSAKFTIYFDVDVNMAITGKSLPDVHSFDDKDGSQEEKSIRSQHIYTVQKFGKSPMEASNVIIWVPTHLRENNIEVARIIKKSGVMGERSINCRILGENGERENAEEVGSHSMPDSLIAESLLKTQDGRTVQEFTAAENSNLHVPPANRTFYLNCTNQAVKCIQVSCKLDKFVDFRTVAKINITLDVKLQNIIPLKKTKDIIYLVSNASVSGITRSGGIQQRMETKFNSTSIGTTFVGSPNVLPVAIWIIVVSILLGLLLLVLLILGLIKLGFFHRGKREELEALKAESDNKPSFVLETSSSRE